MHSDCTFTSLSLASLLEIRRKKGVKGIQEKQPTSVFATSSHAVHNPSKIECPTHNFIPTQT